jgi:hypothetical protein
MRRTALVCAAVGLGIALALRTLGFFAIETAYRMSGVYLVLWPASLGLMMTEKMTAWGAMLTCTVLVLLNALLYGILGFFIAWIVKSVKAVDGAWTRPVAYSHSTMRVATLFGAAGFAIASILVLTDALLGFSGTNPCRYLMPFNPFRGAGSSYHDVSGIILGVAIFAPVNAALYFVAGVLVGVVWRLLRRAKPA